MNMISVVAPPPTPNEVSAGLETLLCSQRSNASETIAAIATCNVDGCLTSLLRQVQFALKLIKLSDSGSVQKADVFSNLDPRNPLVMLFGFDLKGEAETDKNIQLQDTLEPFDSGVLTPQQVGDLLGLCRDRIKSDFAELMSTFLGLDLLRQEVEIKEKADRGKFRSATLGDVSRIFKEDRVPGRHRSLDPNRPLIELFEGDFISKIIQGIHSVFIPGADANKLFADLGYAVVAEVIKVSKSTRYEIRAKKNEGFRASASVLELLGKQVSQIAPIFKELDQMVGNLERPKGRVTTSPLASLDPKSSLVADLKTLQRVLLEEIVARAPDSAERTTGKSGCDFIGRRNAEFFVGELMNFLLGGTADCDTAQLAVNGMKRLVSEQEVSTKLKFARAENPSLNSLIEPESSGNKVAVPKKNLATTKPKGRKR